MDEIFHKKIVKKKNIFEFFSNNVANMVLQVKPNGQVIEKEHKNIKSN